MCGITGLFAKSEEYERRLGELAAAMLLQMADRGPDSAGIAIYRDPAPEGHCKVCVQADSGAALEASLAAIGAGIGVVSSHVIGDRHARLELPVQAAEAQGWISRELPQLALDSAGRTIEIYKDAVAPPEFVERFELATMAGSHAIGHTRMATESRVIPEGSHPFSTGLDICLVHNGSLSNHNRLRAELERQGTVFRTENDTEVAAAYLTAKLGEGASLEQALEGCLADLDGFYTFAVGTADGFAVLRDPIACKPAVMAETDEWVAIASEFRALATLPGAAEAAVWEPEPGVVYGWEKAVAR